MNLQANFASNVRRYRKAANLTQEELAELAGLHRTYIGGIEQQRVNVSLKNIAKISQALNVDATLLFLPTDTRTVSAPLQLVDNSGTQPSRNTPAVNQAALAIWSDDGVIIRPIERTFSDITTSVLVDLIERGYSNDELVKRYKSVMTQIQAFLDANNPNDDND